MRRYLKALFAAAVLVLSGTSALAKSEDLSLMSFNLHGKETDESGDFSWASRKKGCLKAIKKFEPDILCLQEAYSYHKADLMKELNKYMLVDRSVKPGQVDPEVKNNENPIMFRGTSSNCWITALSGSTKDRPLTPLAGMPPSRGTPLG